MNPSIFDLAGKVALVTGGTGHLGSAFSEALASQGAKVVIASRDLEKCRKFAAQLGPRHEALALDLDDDKAVRGGDEIVAARRARCLGTTVTTGRPQT